MMRKILILSLLALSVAATAQSDQEEALILNQELQFLEDSVKNIQSVSINTEDTDALRNKALNETSLERTYFNSDIEEDTVSTRTASPKRRSF